MGYILIGLALLVIVKVYADGDDDIFNETCLQFLDPEQMDKMCCNSLEAFYKFDDGSEECMKNNSEEWKERSCARRTDENRKLSHKVLILWVLSPQNISALTWSHQLIAGCCRDIHASLAPFVLEVDEDGAKKFFDKVEKTIPNEKAVIDRVRNECLNGKYEIYPPEDVCPAIKFYICIYVNVIMGCSSWKKDETCSKMAEDAEKCRSSFKNE
ncbi:unnamed protein product [Euphydryas editha]|uniref:Uncharacterized protein n=1 Tax=Euphydryas editha TaxID=104508 RepID=A0AAU9UYV6_EUPED|nr:unnamed protein product [Euphydryas editha]